MSNSSNLASMLRPRAVAAAVLLLAAASGARGELVEDTVAVVNGQPILKTEYQKNLDNVLEQYRRTVPMLLSDKDTLGQIRRKVLDQMVDDKLFEDEAMRRKVKIHERELDAGINEVKERNFRRDTEGKTLTDEEIDKSLAEELRKEGLTPSQFRERIRKQMMIRRVIEEVVKPKVKEPEETEVKAAFEKVKFVVKGDTAPLKEVAEREARAFQDFGSRVRLFTSERVHAFHILVKVTPLAPMAERSKALARAVELKKQLDGDADFSELAKKHSDDKESAERGGDIGTVVRGQTEMPEFEKAAFSLAVGEVSEPVETNLGYHLIRVVEKKAAEKVTLEKIKADLSQFLFGLAFEKELEKTAQNLRAQAQIEIRLPKDN